jgi:hypothetical protein
LPAGGATVARPFTFLATGTCGGVISPTLQLQDGPRNLGTVGFSLPLGVLIVSFTQSFDSVTTPALPLSWTSSPPAIWGTTTAQRDTPPNSAFAPDVSSVSDYQLISPIIPINSASARLTFRHYYRTESGFDGGVLEISINGGPFTDILTAGGAFVSGAYNDTISTRYSNPLGGRAAWSGDSSGFVTTTVALPAAAAGGNIQIRWRLGNDSSVSATGWYVDTVSISTGYSCCTGAPQPSLTAMRYDKANHTFRFNVTGGTGYSYAVLGSTNLFDPSSWIPLGTNTSPFTFIDSNSPAFPQRFYRARYP